MVLASLQQQACLNTTRQKHSSDQPQILSFRLTCSGHRGLLRYTKSPRLLRTPCSLGTKCGPNKRSGRFKRTHAEARLPHNPAPDSPDTRNSPLAPIFKLGWPLLLSAALACFLFRQVTAPARHQLTPNQAAVAMVSETPHPSTPLHRSAAIPSKHQQQQQQQAFASISSAGFAKLFSGAQRAHLAQLLVYQAQRLLTMNIMTKLLALVILGTPFVAVGGLLYKQASGSTWREALFKSYAVLQNVPGADATVEPNYKASLVINSIFQLGLLTFAVVLGVVCNDISAAVEQVQSGNYTVVESGHTVILNWNKLTIPILRQMAVAKTEHQQGTFKGPVVVLADRDKAEMDAEVALGLQGPAHLEVLTRSGRPQSIGDLEKAAVGRAGIVVMLHPEDQDNAAEQKVAAITGIETLGGGAKAGQNVLIQSGPEDEEADALLAIASQAGVPKHMNLGLVQMKDQERMDRLTAQCAVQPGLGKVYSQILLQSHTSAEFYLKDMFPSLVGKTYGQARRSFTKAVLCGVLDPVANQALLNPADSCVLTQQHRLVFLSSTGKIKPSKQVTHTSSLQRDAATAVAPAAHARLSPEVRQKKHVVIVGWDVDHTVEGLLHGLGDFAPADSSVTIISPEKPDDIPQQFGACSFRHVEGSIASRQVLVEAGVAEADAVILRMPLESLAANDADAQVVSSLVQLQDLASHSSRSEPLHVIASVQHPRTLELINYVTQHSCSTGVAGQKVIGAVKAATGDPHHASHGDHASSQGLEHVERDGLNQEAALSVDMLLPDELLSGLLTQVSVQPELLSVMNDLFDAEGVEIYLRDPARYNISQSRVSFSDVQEAARGHSETAVGYLLQDGIVLTAPHAEHMLVLQPGDQIIAFADYA